MKQGSKEGEDMCRDCGFAHERGDCEVERLGNLYDAPGPNGEPSQAERENFTGRQGPQPDCLGCIAGDCSIGRHHPKFA